jgi:hypothetical protein
MQATGFKQEQRGVALGMAAAALLTIIALSAALALSPSDMLLPLTDRLKLALRCDLFVVVWLAIAIGNVARLRFFSADDIAGSALTQQSQRVRIASAVLQNTLEQVVLAIPIHLALACLLKDISISSRYLWHFSAWAGCCSGLATNMEQKPAPSASR